MQSQQTLPYFSSKAVYRESSCNQDSSEMKAREETYILPSVDTPKSYRQVSAQDSSCSPKIDGLNLDPIDSQFRSKSAFQSHSNLVQIIQPGMPVEWAFQDEKLPKFPTETKSLRVLVFTWNLHGRKPKEEVETLLNMNRVKHHIISIGTEECLRSIQKSTIKKSKGKWTDLLRSHLDAEYIMIKSHAMNALHLTVFVHKSIYDYIRGIESAEVRTGFKNMLGNKGGIGICVRIYDTSFLFINCHLAAGQNHVRQRNEDFERILTELELLQTEEKKIIERIHRKLHRSTIKDQFDVIFWSGDFNYRVNETRGNAIDYLRNNNFKTLLKEDQLINQRKVNRLLNDFQEGEITFPPTYKYQADSHYFSPDCFDCHKKRKIPSWTDRILFRCKDENKTKIQQINYQSIQSVTTSDHRPVFSQFIITLGENSKLTEHRFFPTKENVCNIF